MDSKWIMRGFGVEKMNYWRRVDQVALQAALLLGSWQGRMQAILQCQWVYGLNSGRPGASRGPGALGSRLRCVPGSIGARPGCHCDIE